MLHRSVLQHPNLRSPSLPLDCSGPYQPSELIAENILHSNTTGSGPVRNLQIQISLKNFPPAPQTIYRLLSALCAPFQI